MAASGARGERDSALYAVTAMAMLRSCTRYSKSGARRASEEGSHTCQPARSSMGATDDDALTGGLVRVVGPALTTRGPARSTTTTSRGTDGSSR
jgi:hypothetical protein